MKVSEKFCILFVRAVHHSNIKQYFLMKEYQKKTCTYRSKENKYTF